MSTLRKTKACTTSLLLGCLFLQPSQAAEWSTYGGIRLLGQASDNILLDFGSDEDGLEAIETLRLGAKRRTRNIDLDISATADFIQYAGTDVLEDEDNQRLNFRSEYRSTPRVRYGLQAGYVRDTYSGRILIDEALLETPQFDPDATFAREQVRAEVLSASPSFAWDMNRRLTLNGELSYRDVEYDEQEITTFFDYDDTELALKLDYALSPDKDDVVSLRVARSEYTTSARNGGGDSVRYPVSLEYSRPLTPLLSVSASVGLVRAEFDNTDVEETEPSFGLYLSGRGKLSTYYVGLDRYIRPSSTGDLYLTEQARFNYSYPFKEHQRASLTVIYIGSSRLEARANSDDSEYAAIEPAYTWYLGRNFSVGLRYSFRWRTNDNVEENAESNTVFLSLDYRVE